MAYGFEIRDATHVRTHLSFGWTLLAKHNFTGESTVTVCYPQRSSHTYGIIAMNISQIPTTDTLTPRWHDTVCYTPGTGIVSQTLTENTSGTCLVDGLISSEGSYSLCSAAGGIWDEDSAWFTTAIVEIEYIHYGKYASDVCFSGTNTRATLAADTVTQLTVTLYG